jgi:hypothetical protein
VKSLFGRRGPKQIEQFYRFNMPDFTEIGIGLNNIKKLNQEVAALK